MENIACPLCGSASQHYYTQGQREFLQCTLCLSVFTHPKDYLSAEAEKAHYLCHNNDPKDERYQNFVSPVTNAILNDFSPQHNGLDFGSGTGSPIMKVLRDNDYDVVEFDLFFHNNPKLLLQKYDYIACSETAEHFKEPYREFEQLKNLLKPNGKLYIMTDRFDPNRDFATWFYKTDPTHVFLYHEKAFEWIQQEFEFKTISLNKRLVVLGL
ncbi:methyltransferase domain-containing protein [Flavobacterium sp. Sd200]|uniref:class I SAM-dependent methyltransferase n=1 Tax=Flavobacterium sp. Sd200 TaxID=2692211 RepID=UPI0013702BD8|nr:class I SAM-dependent methyltransferase [Flavobacterium sp. Sd200]MXN92237.1 methyltransferase domain-containing protein [Flavobacterium sp. Sd200]